MVSEATAFPGFLPAAKGTDSESMDTKASGESVDVALPRSLSRARPGSESKKPPLGRWSVWRAIASQTWRHWPLPAALFLYAWSTQAILETSLAQNGGRLVYALDDAYIHMAMAKNFAAHAVWGINPEGFTSSTSSILWTFLLAVAYWIVGPLEAVPFLFDTVSGAAALGVAYAVLRHFRVPSAYNFLALVSVFFLSPLPAAIFSGMEHPLQIAVTTAFVYASARILATDRPTPRGLLAWFLLAPFVTLVRYEGLFFVGVVALLCAVRTRWLHAVTVTFLGFAPIALYGWVSLTHGWYFFPNSVLLKTNPPDFESWRGLYNLVLYTPALKLVDSPHLLAVFTATIGVLVARFRRLGELWSERGMFLVITVAGTYLHLQAASTGWFYRYEAYLVVLGILGVIIGLREHLPLRLPGSFRAQMIPRYALVLLALAILVAPIAERGLYAWNRTARATTNIYEQQYQMGLFLQTYYRGEPVAANDIGAVNFLGEVRCLDLWGLTSQDVARARLGHAYDTRAIFELARSAGVHIAIVYTYWFEDLGGLPKEWVEVGSWTIQKNVVTGGDRVTFFAVDPAEEERLRENLRAFSSQLPRDVIQAGSYV